MGNWIRILSRLVKRLSKAPNLLPPSSPQRKRLEREKQDKEEQLALLEREKEMELYGFLEAEEEEKQQRRRNHHHHYHHRENEEDIHSQILSIYDPDLNMPVDNVVRYKNR